MSAQFRHVWDATDIRASLVGREWIAVVAVMCLAFTTALAALLHIGVAVLDGALRQELRGDVEDVIHVETAAGTTASQGHAALAALYRTLGDARRSPVLRGLAVLRVPPRARPVEVLGVSVALPELQPMTLRAGRWFSAREEREARPVVVLGRMLVDSVFGGIPPRRLRLSRVTLDVIGVAESGAVAPVAVERSVMVTPGALKRLMLDFVGPPEMLVTAVPRPRNPGVYDIWRILERQYAWYAGRLSMASSRERLGDAERLAEALHTGASGLSAVLAGASLAAVAALMLTIARGHARTVGIARALGASRTHVVAQGLLIGAMTGTIGVGTGLALAAITTPLIPLVFDVPAISMGALPIVLAEAGFLPMVMATAVSVVCFLRLGLRAPADLLA